MDEAIDLAIEGRSPYPEKVAFIDADAPSAGHAIEAPLTRACPSCLSLPMEVLAS